MSNDYFSFIRIYLLFPLFYLKENNQQKQSPQYPGGNLVLSFYICNSNNYCQFKANITLIQVCEVSVSICVSLRLFQQGHFFNFNHLFSYAPHFFVMIIFPPIPAPPHPPYLRVSPIQAASIDPDVMINLKIIQCCFYRNSF